MAVTFKPDEVKSTYTVDLEQGDEAIIILSSLVSIMEIEIIFPDDPNGSGIVYTSIDGLEKLRIMIEEEDETGITWTAWPLGNVTPASSSNSLSGYAPLAMKFVNNSSGAYIVRINVRGIFGN